MDDSKVPLDVAFLEAAAKIKEDAELLLLGEEAQSAKEVCH